MSDLISRQKAIDAVEESRRLNHHQDGKTACTHEYEHRHFLKILRDLPSAQKKGEWIYHTEPLACKPYGHYTCNLCNEISWDKTNYCPNCGADMRGGKDGEIH